MPVNKKMSIGEVLRMDGDTAAIFMSFGMHCLGCPAPPPNPSRTPARCTAPTRMNLWKNSTSF